MPETVAYLESEGVIEVRSSGTVALEELLQTRRAVARLLEEHGAAGVLIDARELSVLPENIDMFDFGAGFQQESAYHDRRLAIVSSADVRESVEFFETVTRNRGVNVRVFDSIDAAKSWLTE